MSRRAVAVVVGAAVAGAGVMFAAVGEGSTGRAAPTRCRASGSQTLAQTAVARVYRLRGSVYGCSVRTRLRTRLGAAGIGPLSTIGLVRLAGASAAYEVRFHGVDSGTATVVVRRLTDGKRLGSAAAVDRPLVESVQTVTSIVVKPGGAVAWISRDDSIINNGTAVEVHKLDRGGTSLLLDRGGAIDPSSLRLSGSALTWTDGGATRSSTLP